LASVATLGDGSPVFNSENLVEPLSQTPQSESAGRISGCVHVVDDERAVRESLQLLVSSLGWSCVTYESAEAFAAQFRPDGPGCLVVDLFLTGRNGFSLLREYSDPQFLIPGIAISGSPDSRLALRAVQEGAVTFLSKDCQQQELGRAILMCLQLANEATGIVDQQRPLRAGLEQLSDSEKVVLDYLIQGTPNRAIADALGVSERTLERRRAALLSKLNAGSAAEAAHMVGLYNREEGVLRRRWPVPVELLAGALSDPPGRPSQG
jgi:FixJ family two-component response regulator